MAAADGPAGELPVAVLGTGIMGSAMARNLLSAGLPVTVWDRSSSVTAPLAEAGAVAAASPREAVRDARVVITMLPTADVVNSVIFDGGVVGAFARGCVWAQMGTIGVAATASITDRLGASRPDVMFLDAPVSGSKGPAQSGQLLKALQAEEALLNALNATLRRIRHQHKKLTSVPLFEELHSEGAFDVSFMPPPRVSIDTCDNQPPRAALEIARALNLLPTH